MKSHLSSLRGFAVALISSLAWAHSLSADSITRIWVQGSIRDLSENRVEIVSRSGRRQWVKRSVFGQDDIRPGKKVRLLLTEDQVLGKR